MNIILFFGRTGDPIPKGQPVFFLENGSKVQLLEDPTCFINERYVLNKKETPSQHTWARAARALKNWLELLSALPRFKKSPWTDFPVGDLWRYATRADRVLWRDAMGSWVDPATDEAFKPDTINFKITIAAVGACGSDTLFQWI